MVLNGTSYRQRRECRLCDQPKLERVMSFVPTPPADQYVSAEEREKVQDVFPLDLDFCVACGHLQLVSIVHPDLLFRKYLYVTSSSLGLIDHFRKYATEVIDQYHPPEKALVVEMGSNEGAFLKVFKEKGYKVLGVDPAKSIAERATASGIETWADFFNEKTALKILKEKGPAHMVFANNVFAHSDDLAGMAKGAFHLLGPSGVFVFEVGYLGDIVEKNMLDTVYHEHLSYHSIKPLRQFLNRHGLELVDIHRNVSKGGSFRAFAQRKEKNRQPSRVVLDMIAQEQKTGLDKLETFKKLAGEMEKIKREIKQLMDRLKAEGKSVAGFGASPSTTTLTYYFDLGKTLQFIVDDNPLKQGRFSPGYHIPIYPSTSLMQKKPDYVFLFAWMYADPIFKKNPAFIEQGGRFIIPLPALQIVPPETK